MFTTWIVGIHLFVGAKLVNGQNTDTDVKWEWGIAIVSGLLLIVTIGHQVWRLWRGQGWTADVFHAESSAHGPHYAITGWFGICMLAVAFSFSAAPIWRRWRNRKRTRWAQATKEPNNGVEPNEAGAP